ncbi:MAG: hypothetical protein IT381_10840 [Deltaproteobacteria bacterium]|nr:hypothetical protein [Deltaproteobacteria bacterium]
MKRASLLLVLLSACLPQITIPPGGITPTGTGPTGGTSATGPSGSAATEACATSCGKWLTQCKKDCKVITDAAKRATCTEGCDDAVEACSDACKASSDPEKFDPKNEDFDGKPEPPKATSDTCGAAEQECCTDAQFDECQDGLLKLESEDADGNPVCGCMTSCTKNILDSKNKGADDCDGTHICVPQDPSKAASASNKLFCLLAMCDPAGKPANGTSIDEGCGYPQPRCAGFAPSKPNFGFCQMHCVPGVAQLGCPAGQLCYATYTSVPAPSGGGNQIMPLNVCATKTGTGADGATCAFSVTGSITAGFAGTENCAANNYCTLDDKKCRPACATQNAQTGQPAADNAKCATATDKNCGTWLSNLAGVPPPSGVTGAQATQWQQQVKAAAEDQGPMFYCKKNP